MFIYAVGCPPAHTIVKQLYLAVEYLLEDFFLFSEIIGHPLDTAAPIIDGNVIVLLQISIQFRFHLECQSLSIELSKFLQKAIAQHFEDFYKRYVLRHIEIDESSLLFHHGDELFRWFYWYGCCILEDGKLRNTESKDQVMHTISYLEFHSSCKPLFF